MNEARHMINLDIVAEMRRDVGVEAYGILVAALREEIENGQSTLRRHYDDGNWRRLEVDAHALKSACRSFGADQLANSCMAIEKAAERIVTGSSDKIPDKALLDILDFMITETLQALDTLS